jgi:2-polyprenyl-3-methyl-5-hydroxy-6-metoxy-1,4-benzoquinol methylase/uncharacterized protein YbaR (Trm112 family)
MHQFSLEYLRCVNCKSELELQVFEKSDEIDEGILLCKNCGAKYPIISKIPILWPDLSSYFSNRAQLGGYLMTGAKNPILKTMLKDSLAKIDKTPEDVTNLERRWVATYKNNLKSKFYSRIKNSLEKISKSKLVLEHGCSIGNITKILAQKHETVFGIDQSLFAISEAKKNSYKNLDFFVANSLFPPFGKRKFELVIGLNVLELIEPLDFLKVVSSQVNGTLVISDPYDFERGKNSVKVRVDSKSIRDELKKLGFVFMQKTEKPSFLPWRLNIDERLSLHYRVDLIIARNSLIGSSDAKSSKFSSIDSMMVL